MAEWKKRSKTTEDVVFFEYNHNPEAFEAPEVFIWDIDKTYLDTKFETFRGLLRTATERPDQKVNIPGTKELVRELRAAWAERYPNVVFPIFFVTASPPQMEKKIHEKLLLDGVKPLGIFCKDNLPNLRPRRFWRLNKQVGYKLQSLLQMRALLREDVRLVMFGDDGEADAVIYSLFSDFCARRVDTEEMRQILNQMFVLDSQIDTLFRLRDTLPINDPVDKIYINLADDTDPDYYLKFGRRTLPTNSSMQAAFDLFQDGRLTLQNLINVAGTMVSQYHFSHEEIEIALDDLVRRQRLAATTCDVLIPALKQAHLLREDYVPSIAPKAVAVSRGNSVISLEGAFDPWVPERIEYLKEYR